MSSQLRIFHEERPLISLEKLMKRPAYQMLYDMGTRSQARIREAIDNLPYRMIQFRRTECLGSCPSYLVTLERNGKARYNGFAHVEKLGIHDGKINPYAYTRLCLLLERLNISAMNPYYATMWTDDTTAKLTLHLDKGNERIEISDYGRAGPIELWAIHQTIDTIIDDIEWTKRAVASNFPRKKSNQ